MQETIRLLSTSELFLINGTQRPVDVYVNYEESPTLTSPVPLGLDITFVVDGTFRRPFDTYTFAVRPAGDPQADVLASASVPMTLGKSYSGVFHELPDRTFRFSIFENDLSPGAGSRLTVRNCSPKPTITWALTDSGENPEIPKDPRDGALAAGQWQSAYEITENDYDFKIFEDGDIVARNVDLNLGLEEHIIVHLVGNPVATANSEALAATMVVQELEYDPGPGRGTIDTPAREALSYTDTNNSILFEIEPLDIYQTEAGSLKVTANDPDGSILQMELDSVRPLNSGITLIDSSVTTSTEPGEPGTAIIDVAADTAPGAYRVRVVANRETLATTAYGETVVTIRAVEPQRLIEQVNTFQAEGQITTPTADELKATAGKIEDQLNRANFSKATKTTETFLSLIADARDVTIDAPAADALEADANALIKNIDC